MLWTCYGPWCYCTSGLVCSEPTQGKCHWCTRFHERFEVADLSCFHCYVTPLGTKAYSLTPPRYQVSLLTSLQSIGGSTKETRLAFRNKKGRGVWFKTENLEMKIFRIFADFSHLCFVSEILLKNDRNWQFCCQNWVKFHTWMTTKLPILVIFE